MKIVAVTACPTGIAHTYMAAQKLEDTAKSMGHSIKIETQGALGIENQLTEQDIADADVVLFAVDIAVEQAERFKNIRTVTVPVQEALKNPAGVLGQL